MKSLFIFAIFTQFSLVAAANECLIQHVKGWTCEYYRIFKVVRSCNYIGFDARLCEDNEITIRNSVKEEMLDIVKKNLQSLGECNSFRSVK